MSLITGRKDQILNLAKTYTVGASFNDEAVLLTLQALNSPRSLTVALLFKYNEHQQILDLKCDPLNYNCKFKFRDDYTATEFLSKSTFLKLDVDRKAVAMKKFSEYEDLCHQTNRRFLNLPSDPLYKGSNVWLLSAVTRKIASVLGDFSPEEFFGLANWGPGVSTLLKGENVSAYNKFRDEHGITRYLYDLVGPLFSRAYPSWHAHLTRVHGEEWAAIEGGNVIVTVPKNSKTDRVIAIEPGINLWFQKAIGTMIRRRLLKRGIDLNHQEVNQRLAKQGSIDSSLATVDFSSASDSIAYRLVQEILPPAWFNLLSSCRCSRGIQNQKVIKWEKFSSMGNGFTFELESLIFWAAAEAVKEYTGSSGVISVYGDDVVLPSSDIDLFSSFSWFLGFRVNSKKSFSSTYFRESCGSHYFEGLDCKPIYLKDKLRNVKSVFKLANSIRWLSHRRNNYYGCDFRFFYCWKHLRGRLPSRLRLLVPSFIGDDTGLISNFDEARPNRERHGIEGYHVRSLIDVGITREGEGEAILLASLRALPDRPVMAFSREPVHRVSQVKSSQMDGMNHTLRGRTKLKIASVSVSQWYNLGPWI